MITRPGIAPLPLTEYEANLQAARLRRTHHLSYPALARVMGEFHGHWLSEDVWRRRCREQGIPATPHGRAFNGRYRGEAA